MNIFFLGTNGWYDTETGNTTCILIETGTEHIILDAGNGLYKIDRYINDSKPIYLFLSHFHLDHIIGLHMLSKFNFSQGIDVYLRKGTKKYFYLFVNQPFTMPVNQLKTKIRLKEFDEKTQIPLDVKFRKLHHLSICYGFRLKLEDKIISYCTDTRICQNLFKLAKDADLLITECSYKSGQQDNKWPHLNPEIAAQVAKDSNVKKLALIHFDASLYLTLKDRKDAERLAKKIFKNTFYAQDNQEISL